MGYTDISSCVLFSRLGEGKSTEVSCYYFLKSNLALMLSNSWAPPVIVNSPCFGARKWQRDRCKVCTAKWTTSARLDEEEEEVETWAGRLCGRGFGNLVAYGLASGSSVVKCILEFAGRSLLAQLVTWERSRQSPWRHYPDENGFSSCS